MTDVQIPKSPDFTVSDAQILEVMEAHRADLEATPELQGLSDAEIAARIRGFIESPEVAIIPPDAGEIRPEDIQEGPVDCPMAIAAVIIGVIFMVLGFVGLRAANQRRLAQSAAKGVAGTVAKSLPRWRGMIEALRKATTMTAKAKAISDIGGAAWKAGMFKGILGEIKGGMSAWDWAITGLGAVAQIGALFLTGGAAFAAQVAMNAVAVAGVVNDSVKAANTCG